MSAPVTGLPSKRADDTNPGSSYLGGFVVLTAVGWFATPFVISAFDGPISVAMSRVDKLGDFALAFVSIVAVVIAYQLVNVVALQQRFLAKVSPPTQYVYQSVKSDRSEALILASEGVVGSFNRAQRSAANMRETLPLNVLMLIAATLICPRTATVLAIVYAIARVLNSLGMTAAFSLRFPGFFLGEVLVPALLRGALLRAAVRAIETHW
jgi:uncharacterized membrane protein YecN with MAPEG domain